MAKTYKISSGYHGFGDMRFKKTFNNKLKLSEIILNMHFGINSWEM